MMIPKEIKSIGLEAVVTHANGSIEDLGLVAFAHQDSEVEKRVHGEHPEWEDKGQVIMEVSS